jgi:hypothetical protein
MNQFPLLIKEWPQCLHSSLRSMGRSRVESDIALLPRRAGARVCLSAIGAGDRPSDDAYHPTPKMCTARWSPGRVASLRLRTHTKPPEAGHKDCPHCLLRSFARAASQRQGGAIAFGLLGGVACSDRQRRNSATGAPRLGRYAWVPESERPHRDTRVVQVTARSVLPGAASRSCAK